MPGCVEFEGVVARGVEEDGQLLFCLCSKDKKVLQVT